MSNYETALKAEAKRVVRCWQRYDHEQRSLLASANLRYRSPAGEFFYVHPDIPNAAYPRRKLAAEAAMALALSPALSGPPPAEGNRT